MKHTEYSYFCYPIRKTNAEQQQKTLRSPANSRNKLHTELDHIKLIDTDCQAECKLSSNCYSVWKVCLQEKKVNSFLYQNKVSIGRNPLLSQVTGRKEDDVSKAIICILQCCRWYHHLNLLTTFHHFQIQGLKRQKEITSLFLFWY